MKRFLLFFTGLACVMLVGGIAHAYTTTLNSGLQIDSDDNGCNNEYMTYLGEGEDPGGSWDEACVLESIEIDSNGGSYALYIYGGASGFTDYLIIRDAYFHSATSGSYGSGVKIYGDAHVRFDGVGGDVYMYNNDIGLYLHSVDSSTNGVKVDDIVSRFNNQGVRMYESDYIEFNSSIFDDNDTGTAYGVRVRYSHRNEFDTCGFDDNSAAGIWFQNSEDNEVVGSDASENGTYGVEMDTSDDNVVWRSDIAGNSNYGAHLGEDCDGNYFYKNNFSGNNSRGVQAYDYDTDDTWYKYLTGPGCLMGNWWSADGWSCTTGTTCDSKTICSEDYTIDTNTGTEKDYYPLKYAY
jgi:parallel beta-helix repeat protein